MNEDFLHYIWKYKKINFSNLKTTNQQSVILLRIGDHNQLNSGPDFFNAQLIINDQKWAGNVEIHIKSSDWYVHHHETNFAYDNVILHVVWEDDIDVFRRDNSRIPTLQLKDYVDTSLLIQYQKIFQNKTVSWIQCEKQLSEVPSFTISNWQERLYIERLEHKSSLIRELLKQSSNDWEAVLFKLLAKNFGLKVNGDAFLSVANSFDFSCFRKCSINIEQLEALLYGQANLLDINSETPYVLKLLKQYDFLKIKFELKNKGVIPFQFFRLRPPNFPTIRISQFASLYIKNKQLFREVIETNNLEKFYKLFDVSASEFWKTHYTFDKKSTARDKKMTKSFVHLILINTIIPLKFLYAKDLGKDIEEEIFGLMSQLPCEKNSITNRFIDLGIGMDDALHSQSMIELKNNYCNQKACLKCSIGNYLLNREGSLG
ncbi:Protein of unknown function [Aquimarina amphilecti]|uniref:DUF2851 domain-containing protein n=1 Tax=Aquimarina amphilecti TaxID=1038014 RepID=A0A1H7W651_AQUAM|nr:DUF2851 family protein [Aquimarina amphilecti]SEM17006.1 Protein of unknown function [Aquimarina amphilecti]